MAEIYISTDVETDGPIPGPHSMLSLASAAQREIQTIDKDQAIADRALDGMPGPYRRHPAEREGVERW